MPYGFPRGVSGASELGAETNKAVTAQLAYQNTIEGSNQLDDTQEWDQNGTITVNKMLVGPGGEFPASVVGVQAWYELIGSGANANDNVAGFTDDDSAIRLAQHPVVSVYVMAGDSDVAAIEYEFNGTTLWRLRVNPLNGQIIEFIDPIANVDPSPSPVAETFLFNGLTIHRFTFQAGQDDVYNQGVIRLIPSDTGSVGTTTWFQCPQVAAFYDTTGNIVPTPTLDVQPAYIDTNKFFNNIFEKAVASPYAAGPKFQTVSPLTPRVFGNAGGGSEDYEVDYDNDFGRILLNVADDGTTWVFNFPQAFNTTIAAQGTSIIPQGWFCYIAVGRPELSDSETVFEGQNVVATSGGVAMGPVGNGGFNVPNFDGSFYLPSAFVMVVYVGNQPGVGGVWVALNVGTLGIQGQLVLPYFTVAGLPSGGSEQLGGFIFVTDESGGPVPAYFDGTDWRRVSDGAIVS